MDNTKHVKILHPKNGKISAYHIEDLIVKFSNTSLHKSEWTHQAHIIVALWHNFHYDFEYATDLVCAKIKAYNVSVGTINTDDSGYHETLTVFWMILTHDFLSEGDFKKIEEACSTFLENKMASKNTPLQYYTKEHLFSKQARKYWVNGDIKTISKIKK